MKTSILSIIVLISSTLFLVNCGSSKKAVPSTEVVKREVGGNSPQWVRNRPVDASYYIGIAVASKSANPTSYAIVAQRNALNEMASQIDVSVKSNSMLFSFEDNNVFNDEFKEFVQVKANQQIANYEEVASWENTSEYWVYYRLSKEQFKKDKQAKIDKAINMSVSILQQGEKEWLSKNYKNGMKLFFDALTPIKPYLGEPLQVTLNGTKDVYLGNYIFTHISQGVRAFKIEPTKSIINAVWGSQVSSEDLTFIISDFEGSKLSQIPVKFTYSEGIIRPRDGLSNENGKVFTEIKKIPNTDNLQEVQASIDFESLVVGNQRPDEVTKLVLNKLNKQATSVNIHVKSPTIFVISSGQKKSSSKGVELKDAFISQATKMGFRVAKSNGVADLIVVIKANTKEAGITYDLNNVYLNGTVVVTNRATGLVVYQDNLSSIKGVSSSYKLASQEAYLKAADYIINKIVPRFYRKYVS